MEGDRMDDEPVFSKGKTINHHFLHHLLYLAYLIQLLPPLF